MTYATDLAASQAHAVGYTLVIDGIPVVFGTRSGYAYTTDTGGVTNLVDGTLTSNDAITGGVRLEPVKLDMEMLFVPPAGASVDIRGATAWDRYLRRRDEPRMVLLADVDETATAWSLSDTSGLGAGDLLYVNAETVRVSSVTSSTAIVVQRNVYSLTARSRGGRAHKVGAVVSLSPRFFRGRVAELREWLGDGASAQSIVATYLVMDNSPEWDAATGTWRLRLGDAMRLLDRKVASGFAGATVARASLEDLGSGPVFVLEVDSAREFADAGRRGHVVVWDSEGRSAIEPIVGYSGGWPAIRGNAASIYVDLAAITKARRCYVFTGSPMAMALQVMLSDRGLGVATGTNSATHDVLFGITSTSASSTRRLESDENPCAFGAGVPAGFVDVATLEQYARENVPGFCYVLGAKGEEKLLDVLEAVAYALRGFWHVGADGKLTFSRFGGYLRDAAVAATITNAHWLRGSPRVSADDESEVAHTITAKCNRDPVSGEFTGEASAVYLQERDTYQDSNAQVKLELPGMYVGRDGVDLRDVLRGAAGTSGISDNMLRTLLDRIYAKRCQGIRRYTLSLPWQFSLLRPGDRVSVTSDQHVTFDGKTLDGTVLEVVGVGKEPAGATPVRVDLQDTWSSKRISPTARIAACSGATLTLDGSAQWNRAGFSATEWFAPGWRVRVYDRGTTPANRYATYEDATVASITDGTTLVLTGPLSTFTPAAGDLLVQANWGAATGATENAAQGLSQHDHAYMSGDGLRLGGTDDADRWG